MKGDSVEPRGGPMNLDRYLMPQRSFESEFWSSRQTRAACSKHIKTRGGHHLSSETRDLNTVALNF
jgi:hypothetical protein